MHRMKYLTLPFILLVNLHADYETLNLFGSIGAGFGMGGQWYESSESSGSTTNVTDHFYNYGAGMKFEFGCQYFMMDDVALQPSFSYSAGIPGFDVKVREQNGSSTTTTFGRHLFGLKVQIVPRFEVLDLLDVYTGVGLGLFWNSRHFTIDQTIVANGIRMRNETKGKITSSPTLGFLGMFGTDYPLNDRLTLFGEFAFEQIRFNLKKYVIDEGVEGGSKQIYDEDNNDPDYLNPVKVPGSNFQIRAGVRFAVW